MVIVHPIARIMDTMAVTIRITAMASAMALTTVEVTAIPMVTTMPMGIGIPTRAAGTMGRITATKVA
jgi:hypothetical protein